MPTPSRRTEASITAANVDLSNCDREQTHIPGMIQPHGVMLVLRPDGLTIIQASENTAVLLGIPAETLVSRGLAHAFGAKQAAVLTEALGRAGDRLDSGPQLLARVTSLNGRETFNAVAHRADAGLLLEFERLADAAALPFDLYARVASCISRLQSSPDLRHFLDLASTEIRDLTGFDRVMVYRFAADGSGEVLAEAKRDDLTPYKGLNFPASDIPAPARRLFGLSWLRHLPDSHYQSVRMVPPRNAPVDMSRALLRHVSVMYTDYLKNMGARATIVLPLMRAGQLWGLVSCMHHAGALHVPFEARTAVEILGHAVSLTMASQEDRDTACYRQRLAGAIATISRQMAQETAFHRGLYAGDVTLLGWLEAAGAALVIDGGIVLLGVTPNREQVAALLDWLMEAHRADTVFATDALPHDYPTADAFRTEAAGLLAVRLAKDKSDYVLWFRPEIIRTVAWAGDPTKPVQVDVVDGKERLTPRGSFDAWKQVQHGRSAAWLDCELEAAENLRRAINEALVRQNDELRRSNAELDAFAYVASHDLKEPLRGIHNFAHFLRRSAEAKLTEEERGRIQTIVRLTQRMDQLLDALLKYSRIGRLELNLTKVDLDVLLRQTLETLEPRLTEARISVRVPRPLPTVRTDAVRVGEVFSNLLTNAMKYSRGPDGGSWIEIGWTTVSGQPSFYVRDNGIGIAPQHLVRVFEIFRRLHGRDDYGGGNGVGLTISQRTVDRLGGRLWAESDGPGQGSTFRFTLKAPPIGLVPPEPASSSAS